jgi:hypothetical protein
VSEQTVFQLRLTVEQKERWRAAANGVSLSEWIRDVCDLATEEARLKKHSSLPVRAPVTVSPLSEETIIYDAREDAPVVDNFHCTLGTQNPGIVPRPPMLPPEDERPHFEGIPIVADPNMQEGTFEFRERVLLAPDCVNKHLHWALKQDEVCRFCKGTL